MHILVHILFDTRTYEYFRTIERELCIRMMRYSSAILPLLNLISKTAAVQFRYKEKSTRVLFVSGSKSHDHAILE